MTMRTLSYGFGCRMRSNVDLTNSALFEKLIEEPQLCMLLNPNLSTTQVAALTDTFFVVDIEHEGHTRLAVVCGLFQKQPDELPGVVVDAWGNISNAE